MKSRFGWFGVSLAGVLAGCQLEADVEVVQRGTTPQFVVTYDNGKVACTQGLTVTLGPEGSRNDIWAVRRKDDAPCTDRFDYGRVPPGYEVVVPPRPLSSGQSYSVYANGSGWQASQRSTVP